MSAIIANFLGPHAFLSNFYASTVYLDNKPYPTVEHAYQASKTTDPVQREIIRKAKDPREAKKLGHAIPLRHDWDEIKIPLMRNLIEQKFNSPFLRYMLLETGDAELVHGNGWNDTFFGVCRGKGQNWLGKIIMEVRAEALVRQATEDG